MRISEIIEGSQPWSDPDAGLAEDHSWTGIWPDEKYEEPGYSDWTDPLILRPQADRMYDPDDELEKDWATHDLPTPTWFVTKDFSNALVKKFPEIKNMSAEQQLDVQTKLYNKYIQTYNPGGAPELPGSVKKIPMHSTKHKTPVWDYTHEVNTDYDI